MMKEKTQTLVTDQLYNLVAGFLYALSICYFAKGCRLCTRRAVGSGLVGQLSVGVPHRHHNAGAECAPDFAGLPLCGARLSGENRHQYAVVYLITQLKEKNYDFIEQEMAGIVEECRGAGVISKVIFENCYLTEEEKRALCSIAREVRPDFIKTSTGFGTGGATFEDVALMKKCVGDEVKIKAAGGIRTLDTALRMIELGVSRIGSTASVSIVEELKRTL